MLYFLYGQTLDICELGDSCNLVFKILGPATLEDYEMTFRRLPNLEQSVGKTAHGMLVFIDNEIKPALDENELCPHLYTKKDVIVKHNGLIKARIYVQKFTKRFPIRTPPSEYLANLYQLYLKYGLPLSQINDAMALTTNQN